MIVSLLKTRVVCYGASECPTIATERSLCTSTSRTLALARSRIIKTLAGARAHERALFPWMPNLDGLMMCLATAPTGTISQCETGV